MAINIFATYFHRIKFGFKISAKHDISC